MFTKDFVERFFVRYDLMNKQKKNPHTNLVTYRYRTGCPSMKLRYNINMHWHGTFQCDMEDFKKFFSQIDHGGEVTLLLLRCERGSYMWTPENGWKRCGKKETAEN